MTPDQLERIKAYIQRAKYDSAYGIIKTPDNNPFGFVYTNVPDRDLVGKFIADAINEKLERTMGTYYECSACNGTGLLTELGFHGSTVQNCPICKGNGILFESCPPIQLKNLKDPE